MKTVDKYKVASFVVLFLVVLVSFLITYQFLNLIIAQKIGSASIFYVLLVLVLNFSMFFIVFKLIQVIIEKETTLQKLLQQNEVLVENASTDEKKEEYRDVNIEELVQKIIPAIPQNQSRDEFCNSLLTNLSKHLNIVQGIVYCKNNQSNQFELNAKYALYITDSINPFFEGETLPGQVAADKKTICISDVPENYFKIASGLGTAIPKHVVIFPIIDKEHTVAVVEIATFQKIEDNKFEIFNKLSAILGKILVKLK